MFSFHSVKFILNQILKSIQFILVCNNFDLLS